MEIWDAIDLQQSQVLVCTGAGGKTSLIQSFADCALRRQLPLLITSTTKMYYHQIAPWKPIFADTYDEAVHQLRVQIGAPKNQPIALFYKKEGDKVLGIPPQWIDGFAKDCSTLPIVVEADGAAERLLKAPAAHEPVIPSCTDITVGVLNLYSIGQLLVPSVVHRLPLVLNLLQKKEGQKIEGRDLAILATHPQGIFQYCRGRKKMLLTGVEAVEKDVVLKIILKLRLADSGIDRIITTIGWGKAMRPLEVYTL